MAEGNSAGSQIAALLLLLAILGGAGAWNYKRNLEAEQAQPRPYRTYSDDQLEQLLTAYKGQVDALSGRYDSATGRHSKQQAVQLLGEAVDQFNRVQRNSRAVRELGSQLSQEQASLRAIEQEKALRARMGTPTMVFLRRVFLPPS